MITSWPASRSRSKSLAGPVGAVARILMARSRLPADHVEHGLSLLLAHHAERPRDRVGQRRGILHALAVAAGGAADDLVIRGGIEVGQHHRARPRRPAVARV